MKSVNLFFDYDTFFTLTERDKWTKCWKVSELTQNEIDIMNIILNYFNKTLYDVKLITNLLMKRNSFIQLQISFNDTTITDELAIIRRINNNKFKISTEQKEVVIGYIHTKRTLY